MKDTRQHSVTLDGFHIESMICTTEYQRQSQ